MSRTSELETSSTSAIPTKKQLAVQMVSDVGTCLEVAQRLGMGHAVTVYN